MSGLTVIEVICKFFVDRKINQPNECDSDKKPGRKGKNPIFTEIIIIIDNLSKSVTDVGNFIYFKDLFVDLKVALFLLPRQKIVNMIIVYP